MSVTNQNIVNQYTSTGSTSFAFSFRVISAQHLYVTVNGAVKTLGTDYTVTGVGNLAGGVVNGLATVSGDTVVIKRKIPLTRLIDYQLNGDLLARTLNDDFDLLWQAIQQVEKLATIFLPTPEAGKVLGWDANGNLINITNQPTTPQTGTTAQTITFAQPTSPVVSGGSGTLSASATSGLPVSFTSSNPAVASISGNTINYLAQGTATITAAQAGNSTYAAATPVVRSITITAAPAGETVIKQVTFESQ